jgi:hypothetical protein
VGWGRDIPHVQAGPGAHSACFTMGTGSFPGVKCGRSVLLTTHLLLVPRSWKSRAIRLSPLWATTGPVTGLLYLYLFNLSTTIQVMRSDIPRHRSVLLNRMDHTDNSNTIDYSCFLCRNRGVNLEPDDNYLNDDTGCPQAGPVVRGKEDTSTLPTKGTVTNFLLTPIHNTHCLRASTFQFRNWYQTIYEVVTVSHNCR